MKAPVNLMLQKDAARPTAEQLLAHPSIKKHENAAVDLPGLIHSVFDPIERLKDLSDMLSVHHHMLFHGSEQRWPHMKKLYHPNSTLSFAHQLVTGQDEVFKLFAICAECWQESRKGRDLGTWLRTSSAVHMQSVA